MTRTLIVGSTAGLTLSLLTALSPAAPVPKEASRPVLYFPTRVGAAWTFGPPGGGAVTETVTQVARVDGELLVTVVAQDPGGPVVNKRTFAVSGEGIRQVRAFVEADAPPQPLDPPVWLLKTRSKPGQSWDYAMPKWKDYKHRYLSRGFEEVEVPTGKFLALRVDCESLEAGRVERTISRWYAPGVGVVKAKYSKAVGPGIDVMKTFTPGKD